MLKNNNKINELRDLLDSDDELPTEYNEEPDMPAYLDDHRFDVIEFHWVKNTKVRSIPAKQDIVPVSVQLSLQTQHESKTAVTRKSVDRNMIKRGLLNEQDIVCARSVAARARDGAELVWFIDFLMYKDLQSPYKFLKSCLVVSHGNYERTRKGFSNNMDNYFELIVK